MNAKIKRILIGSLLIIITGIGVSYAYWQITKTQTDKSFISGGCFETNFTEDGAGINLENALPLSDKEGETTSPYKFTITNTCGDFQVYQINLEALKNTSLDSKNIRVSLNNSLDSLNNYNSVDTTVLNASYSKNLKMGGLNKDESITFELRIWLDEETTLEEGKNKIFESKIVIITSPMTKDKYCSLYNDISCAGTLMASIEKYEDKPFLNGPITKYKIEYVEFVNTKEIPSDAIESWDVSEAKDESVMAWYKDADSNSKYEVYIGSTNGVIANENSSYLFADLKYVREIKLDNFYTYNVTNMGYMFSSAGYNNSNFVINFGKNFDTSNVTNMNYMLSSIGSNNPDFNLDLKSFNTSNVTTMQWMLAYVGSNSEKLSIDLSSFDTSKVTQMSGMFFGTGNYSKNFNLDLSNFKTNNLVGTMEMFYNTGNKINNFKLNIKNIDLNKVYSSSGMFNGMNNSSTIYAKNATNINFIKTTSGFPSGINVVDCSINTCP